VEETPSNELPTNRPVTPPCSVCGTTEPPDAQGQCPVKTCRAARVGNKLAAVHDGQSKMTVMDLGARDVLMTRLFRERGGRSALDIVSQLRIEDYATAQIQLGKVTRRLEVLGAVSTAGYKRTSLVDTYNTFSARVQRLAAELPPPLTQAARLSSDGDLSKMTTQQQADHAVALARRLQAAADREAESAARPAPLKASEDVVAEKDAG
jgi:hypothetical protein